MCACGTFEKLPESRKEEILQVCMEEFLQNGYRNASTNTIVKRLGISKGVLFLYFKNKKNLYLYLVEYNSAYLIEDYFKRFSSVLSVDIFDNLGEYYKILLQENPQMVLFMLDAYLNAPVELRDEVEARHIRAHESIYPHLSVAGFREGIDTELVVNLLHMVSYHVGHLVFEEYKKEKELASADREKLRKNMTSFDEIFSKYIDILKYGVYGRDTK